MPPTIAQEAFFLAHTAKTENVVADAEALLTSASQAVIVGYELLMFTAVESELL